MNKVVDFLETRQRDVGEYSDIFSGSVFETSLKITEDIIGLDWTYASMHLVAQRLLMEVRGEHKGNMLLDVSSMFSFVSFASSFYNVVYTESRKNAQRVACEGVCNITGITCEAQNIPVKDASFDVITSLHAIEHFGLGRYRDTLDYYGDQRALREFYRLAKEDAKLILGVPTATSSRIDYNSQRIYSPGDFDKIVLACGFSKDKSCIVYPPNSRQDGLMIGDNKSLHDWPMSYTPPVYLAVYSKPKT